jgi:hypothetical protein
LRAGILPRLRLDQDRWIVLPPFRPGAAAFEALTNTMNAHTRLTGIAVDQWANDANTLLLNLVIAIRAQAGKPNAKIIISIDQMEELYTLTPEDQRRLFLNVIKAALATQAWVVLATLRSDYLPEFQTSPFGESREIVVKPLQISSVREVIVGPARLAGISIQDSVIDAALFDAETGDALPLLAFTLRELFEGMDKKTNMITLSDYNRLGDQAAGLNPIQNAVKKVADQAVRAASPTSGELSTFRNCLLFPAMPPRSGALDFGPSRTRFPRARATR